MSTTKPSTWAAAGAALLAVLLTASWFLLVAPQRARAADLRDQATVQDRTDAQLAARVTELQQEYVELPQDQAQLAQAQRSLPVDAALPGLVRALRATAASAGVALVSLVPGTPAAATAASSAGRATTAGVVAIPVTLTVSGSFPASELFLKGVQTGIDRAFLVSTVAITTGASGASRASGTSGSEV